MSDTIVVPQLVNIGDPCYATEQERYVDYMTRTVWRIPSGSLTGIIASSVAPSVEDQDKIWFKLDAATGGLAIPVPLLWSIPLGGVWVGRHPVQLDAANRSITHLWMGPLVGANSLENYDGGAAGAITATTGPMWAQVGSFGDRIPGGVGTNVVAVATDYNLTKDGVDNTRVQVRGVYFVQRTARIFYTG